MISRTLAFASTTRRAPPLMDTGSPICAPGSGGAAEPLGAGGGVDGAALGAVCADGFGGGFGAVGFGWSGSTAAGGAAGSAGGAGGAGASAGSSIKSIG